MGDCYGAPMIAEHAKGTRGREQTLATKKGTWPIGRSREVFGRSEPNALDGQGTERHDYFRMLHLIICLLSVILCMEGRLMMLIHSIETRDKSCRAMWKKWRWWERTAIYKCSALRIVDAHLSGWTLSMTPILCFLYSNCMTLEFSQYLWCVCNKQNEKNYTD